jgi:hypothetical protein
LTHEVRLRQPFETKANEPKDRKVMTKESTSGGPGHWKAAARYAPNNETEGEKHAKIRHDVGLFCYLMPSIGEEEGTEERKVEDI